MQESFLHYIWQMQYFDKRELVTSDGEPLEIFHPGVLNTHAGPDFSNARLRIGPLSWVGNVEIHTDASDWLNHRHHEDPGYDNVILHVVWRLDRQILRTDHTILPALELRGRIDDELILKYRRLITSSFSIPCKRSIGSTSEVVWLSMMERVVLERLERKSAEVQELYEQNSRSWDETFYQLLARSFGFKVNAEPFFQLAKALPLKLLLKQSGRQQQIEALLFGQAGFLDAARGDSYFLELKREYQLLSQKYSLHKSKMSRSQWRFLRLRPPNFPSLRLAQLGSIVYSRQHLFSEILSRDNTDEVVELFSAAPSEYWLKHYQFSKKSKKGNHHLGLSSVEGIIMNAVVPVWVAYGRRVDDERMTERAVRILQELPAEQNSIVHMWEDMGLTVRTAFDSQALLELFNNFCREKRCLDCAIGASLIRPLS